MKPSSFVSPGCEAAQTCNRALGMSSLCFAKSAPSAHSKPDYVFVDESNGAMRRSVICLLHIASASLLCIEHCTIQTATTMWAQATTRKMCLSSIVGPCRNNSSTHSRLANKQADWSLCLIGLDSWSATA